MSERLRCQAWHRCQALMRNLSAVTPVPGLTPRSFAAFASAFPTGPIHAITNMCTYISMITYTYVYIHLFFMYFFKHIHIHIYMYIYTYIYVSIYIVYNYTNIYIYMYISLSLSLFLSPGLWFSLSLSPGLGDLSKSPGILAHPIP